MMGDSGDINRKFPLPSVKSDVLSGLSEMPSGDIWIDGHNNPGFSGGPLVFRENETGDFKVAGVISAYKLNYLAIYDSTGSQIGAIPENSGIVVASRINSALDVIEENPIGFTLE